MAKTKKQKAVRPATSSSTPSVAEVVQSAPAPRAARASLSTEFKPDYSDVIKDLKRIGTLAGVFFVVLVAISFIIK